MVPTVCHVVAAGKRSHQWCLTLTPNNTQKQLKEWHVIVFFDQSGETLRAAPTQLSFCRILEQRTSKKGTLKCDTCAEQFYFLWNQLTFALLSSSWLLVLKPDRCIMTFYKITKIVRAFWLVKNHSLLCRLTHSFTLSYFIKALEKLVNHPPSARDLQTFLVFSQYVDPSCTTWTP